MAYAYIYICVCMLCHNSNSTATKYIDIVPKMDCHPPRFCLWKLWPWPIYLEDFRIPSVFAQQTSCYK